MRLRDLQSYIDGLDEDSEFAIRVRSIETGKYFGLSYAVVADINEFDELLLSFDVELCLACPFLQKYDWRKNDAARCVILKPYHDLSFDSMRKRRAAVLSILELLKAIRNAQLKAIENTPTNLRGSVSYIMGDTYVNAINAALNILSNIF